MAAMKDVYPAVLAIHNNDDFDLIHDMVCQNDEDTCTDAELEQLRSHVAEYLALVQRLKHLMYSCSPVEDGISHDMRFAALTGRFLATAPLRLDFSLPSDRRTWSHAHATDTDYFYLGVMLRAFPELYDAMPEKALHAALSPDRPKFALKIVDRVCKLTGIACPF
jgi:hypothetical protein